MKFDFRNGASVTLSPVDLKNLLGAAYDNTKPAATDLLNASKDVTTDKMTVAVADELILVTRETLKRAPSPQLERLLRELETDFHASPED